ncbi:RND family efflux transporter MFP subunit [Sphingomicrobium lutaoense]|uniref:RND family efflux transporter MFP subunit n=2 Tax=Sphingomicrobium lutaoense TaxID=515949 RepID=A0A839YXR4_9SPHN|nr:efflux RND transporter periplasmic adaptor subunit [Sphingomicrobium lutaoense]MBB3763098.1 RND family efflux transporter MFP subunit [Sphingomicrobium lutaoense]
MNRFSSFTKRRAIDDPASPTRSKRRMAIIVGVILVIVALVAAAMFMGDGGENAPAAAAEGDAQQAQTVTVIVPGRSEVARTLTASGTLAARRDQPVGIAGQGGRVTQVLVDAGDWVRQGQLLASIDRSVQAQQAAQLRASLAAAQADADLARNELDRAAQLVERGFVSKADIDRKQAAYDAAVARVGVARAQLAATNAQIGQLDVRAPTSGLILDRNVEVGQVVSAGTPQLFRMARGGEMELRARLSQQDLTGLSVGLPATVIPTGTDRRIQGRIWQISPIIDPQSRQGEVRIAIPYDRAIRPGGFAEALIESGVTNAPLLPQSAVLADARGNYVYIVNGDNEVERRDVRVGTVDDRGVTIASGIDGSEAIVARAGSFLTPGQKVSPRRQAAREE